MKKILVLGPGCPRCETLFDRTREAAEQLAIDYELEKVTNITQFASHGVMMTPGLVVDGKLTVQGKVPSLEEIKAILA